MTTPAIIRTTGWVIVALLLVMMFGTLAMLSGPELEGRLFPIINATHVAESVQWSPQEVCWSVHYRKFRNDAPAYFNYRIRFADKEERIPLAVYRMADDASRVYLSTYGFANHGSGQTWTARYCADLPRDMSIKRPFIIEGEGFYDTWHHRWLVPQALPSFEVPGTAAR